MTNKRAISFTLLACIFLICGCKVLPSGLTKTQDDYEIDGHWGGYTDQKQIIAFTIENRKLTHLEIDLRKELDCPDGELRRFTPENPSNIIGNSIVTAIYGDVLTASFTSNTEASGTFETNGGRFGDRGCLGNTVFKWKAIRQVIPDDAQCISSISDQTLEEPQEPRELQLAPDGTCVEMYGVKRIKHAIGSRIAPSSVELFSYFIWIPERVLIMKMVGSWDVVGSMSRLEYKDNRIWMPGHTTPVLEWNGEFYIALVNFYGNEFATGQK